MLFFVLALLLTYSECQLDIVVENDGSFVISVNSDNWFKSADVGLAYKSSWFSNFEKDNKLSVVTSNFSTGSDDHGKFDEYTFDWSDDSQIVDFTTKIQVYVDFPAVVFVQEFPSGSYNIDIDHDLGDVVSVFPSFEYPAMNDKLKYLTYMDTHSLPMYGHWGDLIQKLAYKGGMNFGPICFYNEKLDALLVSSYMNFMSGSCVRDSGNVKNFGCGIQGMVENIPKGFVHKTLMYYSEFGVNDVFQEWGGFLLEEYGKKKVKVEDDVFLSHLTYYTDRGAYYYHGLHDINVEPYIFAIDQYTKAANIPIRSMQYDAWWVQSNSWGMYLWEPNNVSFPDGFLYVYERVGLPTVLWSRQFSKQNYYSEYLGFPFHVDESTGYALPKTKELYLYIMNKSKVEAGMSCFEHDFLTYTFSDSDFLQKDVYTMKRWFSNFTSAAGDLGLTVQLCMVYPFYVLGTLETDVVTHVRASTDYIDREQFCLDQWNIALASMYYYAVGVMPHKDNWWSSSEPETDCGYKQCQEKNPILQAVASTLSLGPVAISDKINMTNVTLIDEIVRPDGYILRPDKPLMPVDEVFRFKYDEPITFFRDIHSTETCFSGDDGDDDEICFYYLFFNDVFEDFELKPSLYVPKRRGRGKDEKYVVMEYTPGEAKIPKLTIINETNTMTMKRSKFDPIRDLVNFNLYHIAPLDEGVCGGVNFLKEMKKISFVSKQRISKFQCLQGGGNNDDDNVLYMELEGVVGEKATFAFLLRSTSDVVYVDCVFSSSVAKLSCKDGECTCG